MLNLFIKPNGTILSIYQEALDLNPLGSSQITRASHVEPGEKGDWEVRMVEGGEVHKGFRLRSEALAFEVKLVEERLMHE